MGDWLQGPYVYALYSAYNFSKQEIGVLFIVGFGSSMIFGVTIGSLTDRHGRKISCLAYCAIYILSCMTKHSSSFSVLLLGRVLGGAAYSILFTSFDSWLISEHNRKSYPSEWLNQTFQYATICNGIAAIVAGQVGSWVRDYFDSLVAPFDAAILFLSLAAVIIALLWGENKGGEGSIPGPRAKGAASEFIVALNLLRRDPKFCVLGLVQSFYESAMYIVVFMWTPKLEIFFKDLNHGQVFGCFMACTMIGSCCVDYLTRWDKPESYLRYIFVLSAASMMLPSTKIANGISIVASFFIFEFLCGVFWPSKGIVKSNYVPEDIRATMYNIFRVPLNLIVCVVLSNLENTTDETVFQVVVFLLGAAAFMQHTFYSMLKAERRKTGSMIDPSEGYEMAETMDHEAMMLPSSDGPEKGGGILHKSIGKNTLHGQENGVEKKGLDDDYIGDAKRMVFGLDSSDVQVLSSSRTAGRESMDHQGKNRN